MYNIIYNKNMHSLKCLLNIIIFRNNVVKKDWEAERHIENNSLLFFFIVPNFDRTL